MSSVFQFVEESSFCSAVSSELIKNLPHSQPLVLGQLWYPNHTLKEIARPSPVSPFLPNFKTMRETFLAFFFFLILDIKIQN